MTPEERAQKLSDHLYRSLPDAERWKQDWMVPYLLASLKEAVAKEREACAAEIEKQCRMLDLIFGDGGHGALCRDLAEAVRKRGE